MRRRSALVGLGTLMLPWPAPAKDYKPATCATALPYRGGALHPAPAIEMLTVTGEIGGRFDAATIRRLEAAAGAIQDATKAPSMTLCVAAPGRAVWSLERGGDPARPAPLHFWASAGKTFTAVTVLQLVEQGRLSLSDPISRWISGAPNGQAITVCHLLEHTSGLFSANEDLKAHAEPRFRTPEESLAIAARHGAMFCPGELWRYSNTGYDLLGRIIEQVDGRPYAQAIAARIVTPLGLERIRVLAPDDMAADVAPLVSSNETPIHPAWAGAAGPMVGSAESMARFWRALLADELLRPETKRLMFSRLYPMFTPEQFYGLGVMLFDIPGAADARLLWVGHAGGAPGAQALVAYSPAERAIVAVALTGDGSAAASANLLLRQLHAPTA